MVDYTLGLIFSTAQAVVLLLLGAVAFHRRRVANTYLPHSFLSLCVGYGVLSLIYRILLWMTPLESYSEFQTHLFYFNRSIFFILLAVIFIQLVWREGNAPKLFLKAWLVVVVLLSVAGYAFLWLPKGLIPISFFTPINFFYYVPRLPLFAVMAAFGFRAVKSKNLMLAAISFSSFLYFAQTILKFFQPQWAAYAIQVTMDNFAGLIFAILLFLSLFQRQIELAFYVRAKQKAKLNTATSLSLQSAGFLQFLFVGTVVNFSGDDEENIEQEIIARRLHEFVTTAGKGKKVLFTFSELIPLFNNDNLTFVKFMRNNCILPRIIDGKSVYHRDDLLHAAD